MRSAVTANPPTPVLGAQGRREPGTLTVQVAVGGGQRCSTTAFKGLVVYFAKKQQESLGC